MGLLLATCISSSGVHEQWPFHDTWACPSAAARDGQQSHLPYVLAWFKMSSCLHHGSLLSIWTMPNALNHLCWSQASRNPTQAQSRLLSMAPHIVTIGSKRKTSNFFLLFISTTLRSSLTFVPLLDAVQTHWKADHKKDRQRDIPLLANRQQKH